MAENFGLKIGLEGEKEFKEICEAHEVFTDTWMKHINIDIGNRLYSLIKAGVVPHIDEIYKNKWIFNFLKAIKKYFKTSSNSKFNYF